MKKLLILVAALMLAIPAFSQASRFPGAAGAGTTLNDDSCDIGVTPAATLLLPYFEVDFDSNATEAVNTVFTITNVSDMPQIAHITVWTDWSVPVLDFNIFLTGYDVQGISLYDIIARGQIPPTSILTGNRPTADGPEGPYSEDNIFGNPAFRAGVATQCANLPGQIPASLLTEVQDALTGAPYNFTNAQGIPTGCQVGGAHDNAVGYVTVDVARTCSTTLPVDPTYYGAGGDIAYDNVLIGDYQRINPTVATGNYAGGNPLVHIRAIPEGTLGGFTSADVTFPYTFYRRYQDPLTPAEDRRQPLPGVWAARFIEENEGVGQEFATDLAIWREGVTEGSPTCTGANAASQNAGIPLTEVVRFDEQENPTTLTVQICRISPCPVGQTVSFPETGAFSTTDELHFPPDNTATADNGGWMYLNLNHGADAPLGTSASQNWVTIMMTAEGRYGVDFDAAWLGNGCSGNPGVTEVSDLGSTVEIGPIDNNPFDAAE